MSRYNVNEEYDEGNRREVMLTGFSSNTLDDVLRSNNNEPNALNGNPGDVIGSHVHTITKDTKVISFEGMYMYAHEYMIMLKIGKS